MLPVASAGVILIALVFGATTTRADETSIAISPVGSSEHIPATLMRPAGAGPFPAIIIAHDCSGLGWQSSGAPGRWAKLLVQQGYVVVMPDTFTPRGLPAGVCTEPPARGRVVNGFVQAADAYGALAYLRAQPFVDGRRVGLMGGSHGGWAVLAAMVQPPDAADTRPLPAAKANGFAAAVALYPPCAAPYGTWSTQRADGSTGPIVSYAGVYKPIAPVLILIGDKDDWTPAEPCRRLVETAQAQDYPMQIKIYPDAYHSFDSFAPMRYVADRTNVNMASGHGATTGGNAEAWADARQTVSDFFARHLKQP